MFDNLLISREGFLYLLSLTSRTISRASIEQVLLGVSSFTPNSIVHARVEGRKRHKRVKALRKEAQISGLLDLIDLIGKYDKVLEVGCGIGLFAQRYLSRHPDSKFNGIDISPEMVQDASGLVSRNAEFQEANAYNFHPGKTDLIVSLHGCGSLTDRILDIAVQAKADVICVPCCYSKISRTDSKSQTLRDQDFARILKRTARLESGTNAIVNFYRTLVNIDRLLYLKERGYEVAVSNVTQEKVKTSEGEYRNSTLNQALIGRKK